MSILSQHEERQEHYSALAMFTNICNKTMLYVAAVLGSNLTPGKVTPTLRSSSYSRGRGWG